MLVVQGQDFSQVVISHLQFDGRMQIDKKAYIIANSKYLSVNDRHSIYASWQQERQNITIYDKNITVYYVSF